MQYNLSKDGANWLIEVSGAPYEEPMVKSFGSREEAEKWRHDIGQGTIDKPTLKPYGAPKTPAAEKFPAVTKPKAKAKKK